MVAAVLLSCTGCPFGWGQGKSGGKAATAELSGPEAQRILMLARKLSYEERTAKRDRAIRLADSVIRHCGVRRYAWEAFRVKAVALTEAKDHPKALATAAEGIRSILALDPAPLAGDSLRALKMLLPVYVENSARSDAHKEGATALEKWRTETLNRYPADLASFRDEREGLRLEFKLLREMIEEHAAARGPQSQIKSLVLTYLRLYNTNSQQELVALLGEKENWPAAIKSAFTSKQQPDSTTKHLYLVSAVKLEIVEETKPASPISGHAVCDIMATSSAGWATLVKGVRFSFVSDDGGAWRIKDIDGHP